MRENLHTPDKAVLKEAAAADFLVQDKRERAHIPSSPPPKKLSTFHAHKTGAQDN